MPVGITPATTFHRTGVGVAPVGKVVLQPVLAKSTTDRVRARSLSGPDGVAERAIMNTLGAAAYPWRRSCR